MANKLMSLRMPAEEIDALHDAARANTRTLQDEVRHRMWGSAPLDAVARVAELEREILRLNGVIEGLKMALGLRK